MKKAHFVLFPYKSDKIILEMGGVKSSYFLNKTEDTDGIQINRKGYSWSVLFLVVQTLKSPNNAYKFKLYIVYKTNICVTWLSLKLLSAMFVYATEVQRVTELYRNTKISLAETRR